MSTHRDSAGICPERAAPLDWSSFVRDHWEKAPTTFRHPDSSFDDEPALFRAIVEARRQIRDGAIRDHRDVTYHDGTAAEIDPSPFLPLDSEATLDAYLDRLSRNKSPRGFTLLINNFQQFSDVLAIRMRLFLQGLFQAMGRLPAGTVSSHLMVASYGTSPYAVHKDPNSVFTFVLRGAKTLRVWPFSALAHKTQQRFAEHLQLNLYGLDYHPYVAESIPLVGRPGTALYWPSTYWHVGEAEPGEIHVSLHLTCDVHSEPRGELVDLLRDYIDSTRTEDDWSDVYTIDLVARGGALQLPTQLTTALEELTHTLRDTVADKLSAMWLSRVSGQGFIMLPRVQSPGVDVRGHALCADPRFPVYWSSGHGVVTCAAHGQVLSFSERAWTPSLLDALTAGKPFWLRDIVPSESDRDESFEDLVQVASHLSRIGALQLAM
jgi:50S ribosomal protein L16 3-hydroxylase